MNELFFKIIKNGLWLFLMLYAGALNAQIKVTGKVIDEQNLPIEFANAILLNQDTNEIITGTITGDNGNFTLTTDQTGKFILQISFVGFEDYIQTIDSTIHIGKIVLPENNLLAEVVVIGKRNVIERNADKLIFNVENSPVKSGYDGVEVLKRAPSIFIDGKENILIQNKPATVLINGRKLNISGDELASYLKSLDASNIKKIEIQTNASSEMDANVQGGVINIVLKEKRTGLFSQFKVYHTQRGSHPNFHSSGNFNYGTKKWNIYSNISFNDTEDSGKVISSTYFNNINRQLLETGGFLENAQRYTFTIGSTFQPAEKHEIGFELYTTKNNSTNKGNSEIDIYTDNFLLDKGITNTPRYRDTKYSNASINYSVKIDTLGGKISFIGDYASQNFNSGFDASTTYEQAYYDDISERSNTDASTNILSAQLDFNKRINKIGELSLGVKTITTNRKNKTIGENFVNGTYEMVEDRTNSYDFSENIFAGYFMLNRKIFKGVSLKFGLRVENTQVDGVNLLTNEPVTQNYLDYFPSVFLSKEIKNNQSISLNYNRRISRPSFSVLNPYVIKINDFSYQIGNPELKPQYFDNFEITYNVKRHSFSVFYNHTSNLISGVYFPVNEAIYYQSQNVGKGKIVGLDYSFGNNIKKWWYLKLGATLQNQNYYFFEQSFHSNTASFNISSDWKISESWSVYLSTYYSLPRIYSNLEVADLFRSDCMIEKSFFEKMLRLRFYVDDIFNTVRDKNRGFYDEFVYDFYQKRNTQTFTLWALFTIDTNSKIRKSKNKSSNDNKNRL